MKTIITAHSGSDGTPDNSLEFVRYALTSQAEALEVDVRIRSDGTYFLSHDESEADCPTLADVFALLQGSDKLVNADLKEPDMELGVLALAKEYRVEGQLLFSGDVNPDLVRRDPEIRSRTLFNLKPFAEEVLRRNDRGQEPTEEELEDIAAKCRTYGVGTINIPYSLCTERFLAFFRERGIEISAWTVGDPEVARCLFNADIRNVTTRRPQMLCQVRNDMK